MPPVRYNRVAGDNHESSRYANEFNPAALLREWTAFLMYLGMPKVCFFMVPGLFSL
jgi:hypothetical protein